jgi:AmmeMemoRadiSam system protein B
VNPRLREVRAQPLARGTKRGVVLTDPLGISEKAVFVPQGLTHLLALLDGSRDRGTIRAGFELRTGIPLSASALESVLEQLDSARLLDNERFAQAYRAANDVFRHAPSRPPVLAGKCYPENAADLADLLQNHLTKSQDDDSRANEGICGIVSPHIDFARGCATYAKVWDRAAPSVREAELIVILGTDHSGREGAITLTRQNYETPLGILPTDVEYIDEIAAAIGETEAFRDELHHRSEHSIEAALVWLHHLMKNRTCSILPILCGSFRSFIDGGVSPSNGDSVSATIAALRKIVSLRRTLVVAAADLAHVGPAFGDRLPLEITERARLAGQDQRLMVSLCQGRAGAFFEEIRAEGDQRRICGLPAIYVALSVLPEVRGDVIDYAQCPASEDGGSVVSICGMVFRPVAVRATGWNRAMSPLPP